MIYFSGPAGSGKSYQMASYLRNYKKKFKDNKIFLISEKEEDKTLDTIADLKRIKIDDSLIEDPLDLKDFTEIGPCIVLFDDIDSLENKMKKAVYLLLSKLLKIINLQIAEIKGRLAQKQNYQDHLIAEVVEKLLLETKPTLQDELELEYGDDDNCPEVELEIVDEEGELKVEL